MDEKEESEGKDDGVSTSEDVQPDKIEVKTW